MLAYAATAEMLVALPREDGRDGAGQPDESDPLSPISK